MKTLRGKYDRKGTRAVLMEEALTEILNLKEDRALIVDMGPSEGRVSENFTTLGNARELPRRSAVIV